MSIINTPPRGFPTSEFEQRTVRVQQKMARGNIDAILLTTEPEVRYFSGFQTQFWKSPTRPWFLIIPASDKPIAVIPEIGVAGMNQTWIEDIRSWPAPIPGDDGISLLIGALKELCIRSGRLGVPLGHETHLRMPAGDFRSLCDGLGQTEIVDVVGILRELRVVKSEAEIEKIHYVCQLVSTGFEELPNKIRIGQTERDVCRQMKSDLLKLGVDDSPYLIGASGAGGPDNIIMGPTDRSLSSGDILIIDTGTTFDGYFCDFDRNFAMGTAPAESKRAYDVVYAATEAGFTAAVPGATTTDLYTAMWKVLEAGGALGNDVGRLGHGLGMQLTEYPSNKAGDDTPLLPGMVLTLEPGMEFAPGKMMVHEENIVIRENGAQWLSRRAPAEMPIVL